jgi:hypothetical protein
MRLAQVTGDAGQVEDGLRLVPEALAGREAEGQGDLLADAHRLQGEYLLV